MTFAFTAKTSPIVSGEVPQYFWFAGGMWFLSAATLPTWDAPFNLYASADLDTWVAIDDSAVHAASTDISSVFHAGGYWFIDRGGSVAKSDDLSAWSSVSAPSGWTGTWLASIASDGTTWVACRFGGGSSSVQMARTTNLSTWTTFQGPAFTAKSVAWFDSKFWVGGPNGGGSSGVSSSPDSITWTSAFTDAGKWWVFKTDATGLYALDIAGAGGAIREYSGGSWSAIASSPYISEMYNVTPGVGDGGRFYLFRNDVTAHAAWVPGVGAWDTQAMTSPLTGAQWGAGWAAGDAGAMFVGADDGAETILVWLYAEVTESDVGMRGAAASPLGSPAALGRIDVAFHGKTSTPLGQPKGVFVRPTAVWSAALTSPGSTAISAYLILDDWWSAAVMSPASSASSEAWAGTLEMPALGIGYSAQGAERNAVASITITCEIGGAAYPAQWLTIRKRLANGDGTASYGAETADVAIPYTRAVFAALLAAYHAGETLSLSARYVLNSGAAYVRPLGEFALTAVKRSSNGVTVVATGERFPVYAVSDDPVELAGSCYETSRSVRCAVDHQVYPGQAVQGQAAAFTCDAVTITLDAPQASAIMEVFAH